MVARAVPAGRVDGGLDLRTTVLATFAATAIFVVVIWTYSFARATATCHNTQGHIKFGKSVNGMVCYYHGEVRRVAGS